jgi:hypothetical protein
MPVNQNSGLTCNELAALWAPRDAPDAKVAAPPAVILLIAIKRGTVAASTRRHAAIECQGLVQLSDVG